jgi:hypothetical protein
MNKYREERIDMIIAMMMTMADISEEKASELLKLTITYQNIIDGEECTLYESYSANLEDVVEELQESDQNVWVKEITEDAVTNLNKRMLDEGIKSAEQLKEAANARQAIVTVIPYEKISDRERFSSKNLLAGSVRRRKPAKTNIKVAACKAGTSLRNQNKAGRVACKANKNSARSNKGSSGWKVR